MSNVNDKELTAEEDLLTKQRKLQSGENLYACSLCEKRFSSQDALRRHTNIHIGKHKCPECGRCCGSRPHLAEHMRSHSGEKPFLCTVCGKRFTQSRHLVVHSRIHSAEKPYTCHLCHKTFSQNNLNRHLRVHTGEKAYSCYVCGKMFMQSGHLKGHILIHTRQKP